MFDLSFIVVRHASALGEAIRKEEYGDAAHEVGRLAVWLVSLVARLQDSENKRGVDRLFEISTPLSQIIWTKYPNCCPACYGDHAVIPQREGADGEDWRGELQQCDCLRRQEKVETRNIAYSSEEKEDIKRQLKEYATRWMPVDPQQFSFDSMEERFMNIFGPAIRLSSPESVGFHLLEEVGEMCEALVDLYTYAPRAEATPQVYQDRKLAVENEIADVFSWLFAASIRLRLIYQKIEQGYARLYPRSDAPLVSHVRSMWVSRRIWAEYGKDHGFSCRVCGQLVCNCDIHLATTSRAIRALQEA